MATSAIASCIDKYNTLTDVPTLYFGDVPPANGPTQIYPPYVVLLDEGMAPEFVFELSKVLEPTQFTFMVYAPTLAAVDAVVQAIKYDGDAPSARAGFDFGSLPSLDEPYRVQEMKRTLEKRFVASIPGTGPVGQRFHGCELRYRVTLFLYGE